MDVILSFGGWLGADPAAHCDSPQALAAAYRQVIGLYHVRQLDFDIEGPGGGDDCSGLAQEDWRLSKLFERF